MKIPRSVTVNTGEQGKVYEDIEKFLTEARSEIEKNIDGHKRPSRFQIRLQNLCSMNPLVSQSDEFAHLLFYREKVVASVLETRTEWNYVHFDYFLHLPKKF